LPPENVDIFVRWREREVVVEGRFDALCTALSRKWKNDINQLLEQVLKRFSTGLPPEIVDIIGAGGSKRGQSLRCLRWCSVEAF
jgi:hypothetical protein